MSRWSPFDIRLMIHFCTTPTERFQQASAPIYPERVKMLLDAGLIQTDGKLTSHTATDKGCALVAMWCETPLPEMRFVDPRFAAETP